MLKNYSIMKIIFFQCLLFYFCNNVYAEDHKDIYAKASSDVNTKKNEYRHIPHTLGIYGNGYFLTGATKDIGDGGGVGINFKANINKYFGIATHFNYTYGEYSGEYSFYDSYYGEFADKYKNKSHLIDIRVLMVIQRETEYRKKGFVPWAHIGMSTNFGVFDLNDDFGIATGTTMSGAGVGLVVGGGVKYNFEKFYIGASFDYTLAFLSTNVSTPYGSVTVGNTDPSGVRVYAEIGLRL